MSVTGAGGFARRVARRYSRGEAARRPVALPLVKAGSGGPGTTTYGWRWDIRVSAPVERTPLQPRGAATFSRRQLVHPARSTAQRPRTTPAAPTAVLAAVAATTPPVRPTTAALLKRHEKPAPQTYAPQPARVPPVPRAVVPATPQTQTPSDRQPQHNGSPASHVQAAATGTAAAPVPGWGAPILTPATVPAAPRPSELPDLRRLAEEVAVQLERRSVAARERRGRA